MSRNNNHREYPEDVGILAVEMYFPKTYVAQERLEEYSQVSKGKFTIGLGQDQLAFVNDREDIYSMALTVVANLMDKYSIRYEDVGRVEVGTETIADHSKSVKSVIMQLFADSGNTSVEGIDNIHACYAGTAALFNSIAWVESSYWDGRYALVIAADIAEYASGPARPTGGAGAIAMLIGPNAPLVFERGLRTTHMEHAYDFYKPRLSSPYPVVDGHFSNVCYLKSVDVCYQRLLEKIASQEGRDADVNIFDYVCFHSPYNKLVQKSFARILYNDYLRNRENPLFTDLSQFKDISIEDSYDSAPLMKTLTNISKPAYKTKVQPTTVIPKAIGNMYTASLYASLVSLLAVEGDRLAGKRILMFSYGSGLAASMFSIRARENAKDRLREIQHILDIQGRLNARVECPPSEFADAMVLRETLHNTDSFAPSSDTSSLFPGTFYLTNKDDMCRRYYQRV